LIANELVAFKHAFPRQPRNGRGFLQALSNDKLQLEVRDDGVGFPAEMDVHAMSSMGMSIIRTLTEQISGTLGLDRTRGTRFTIVYPG
jgi:two-component sensor histidine kinase